MNLQDPIYGRRTKIKGWKVLRLIWTLFLLSCAIVVTTAAIREVSVNAQNGQNEKI